MLYQFVIVVERKNWLLVFVVVTWLFWHAK